MLKLFCNYLLLIACIIIILIKSGIAGDVRSNFTIRIGNNDHINLANSIRELSRNWITNFVHANILPPRNRLKIGLYGCLNNGNCNFYVSDYRYISGFEAENGNDLSLRNIYPQTNFNMADANNDIIINDFQNKNYDIRRKPLNEYRIINANPNVIELILTSSRLIANFRQTFGHTEQALTSHLLRAQNIFINQLNLNNMQQYDYYIFLIVSTNKPCNTCLGTLNRLLNNQANNFRLNNVFSGHNYPWRQTHTIPLIGNTVGGDNNLYRIQGLNNANVYFIFSYQGVDINIQNENQQNINTLQYAA